MVVAPPLTETPMRCFKCEKVLREVREDRPVGQPDGGGDFVLSFTYGSGWDQMKDWYDRSIPEIDPNGARIDNLLNSGQIRGYVCDECFQTHHRLLEGWNVSVQTTNEKVVADE